MQALPILRQQNGTSGIPESRENVCLSRRMFESFTQKETELGIRAVKSRSGRVGAASERCNSILAALENAASENA